MKTKYLLLILIAAATVWGCRKNDVVNPALPDTKVFVDKINLHGDLRLGTSVEMHWSGTCANGYITGYEFSFDNTAWTHTAKTDSTFLFSLQKGQDTADISFYIRAIDNYGHKDPSPAKLVIPIKNSPPVALFSTAKTLADTVYGLFSIEWTAHDRDGDETIDSIFVKFNNGSWYALSSQVNFATFIPENISGTGTMNAQVYKGNPPVLLNNKISGLKMNGHNRLYIRARDKAGIYSAIDSTTRFYLKRKSSDLLVINANASADPGGDVVRSTISAVYGRYDYMDLARDNQKYQPLYWDPTFSLQLRQYNKVIIYSDGFQVNGKMQVEYAGNALNDYINHGGKLMVSVKLPLDLDPASPLYIFSPADSISRSGGQARFYKDSLATPDPATAAGYPALKNSAFILGFEPIYLKPDARPMYRAHITKIGGWKGPDIVSAKTINTQGKTNQVFWALDLTTMDGDPQALKDYFTKVLMQEFNW